MKLSPKKKADLKWNATKRHFASILSGIRKARVRIEDSQNGELGYTYGQKNTIYLAREDEIFKTLSETEKEMMQLGVGVHEVLHLLFTNFDYEARRFTSLKSDGFFKNEFEEEMFLDICNLVEDPAIENMAGTVTGGVALKALYFAIEKTYQLSGTVDECCKYPMEEMISALLQFGDLGIIKGDFRFPETKSKFAEIAPTFYDAINCPDGAKRVDMAADIFDACRPLWENTDQADIYELMKKLKELLSRLQKSGGRSDLQKTGAGQNGQMDPESSLNQKRKITIKKVTREEYEKMKKEQENQQPATDDGKSDIEIVIPEDLNEDDLKGEEENNTGGGASLPIGSDGTENKETSKEKENGEGSGQSAPENSSSDQDAPKRGAEGDDSLNGSPDEAAGRSGSRSKGSEKGSSCKNTAKSESTAEDEETEGTTGTSEGSKGDSGKKSGSRKKAGKGASDKEESEDGESDTGSPSEASKEGSKKSGRKSSGKSDSEEGEEDAAQSGKNLNTENPGTGDSDSDDPGMEEPADGDPDGEGFGEGSEDSDSKAADDSESGNSGDESDDTSEESDGESNKARSGKRSFGDSESEEPEEDDLEDDFDDGDPDDDSEGESSGGDFDDDSEGNGESDGEDSEDGSSVIDASEAQSSGEGKGNGDMTMEGGTAAPQELTEEEQDLYDNACDIEPEVSDEDAAKLLSGIEREEKEMTSQMEEAENYFSEIDEFTEEISEFPDFARVPMENHHVKAPAEYLSDLYDQVVEQLSEYIDPFTTQIHDIFETDRVRKVYSDSGRVHVPRLATKKTTTVFRRRIQPDHKNDVCFVIAVDNSGSTNGEKNLQERYGCIGIAEALAANDIPLYIFGFNTGAKNAVQTHFVRWENTRYEREMLVAMTSGGCNFDSYAIRYATELLKERDERNKILIVISDGMPSFWFSGTNGITQNELAISDARNEGIHVLGVGVGNVDDNAFSRMYGRDYYLPVQQPSDLFDNLADRIVKFIDEGQ